ncbi:MAG TPA: thermonuclease family protein [Candidatus Limnocylindria bacterium]|jgi:micrococcal nuclease|nr:thermonuclease family protein [Candidatus Limnocylindria bacterium]
MRVTRSLLALALLAGACQPALVSPTSSPLPSATSVPPSRPTSIPTPSAAPAAAPTATPTASAFAPTGPTQQARVVRVVDGDTIRVEIDGREHRLRYIGIDTPETVHPSRPVEWMGREATAANRQLVDGKSVVLESDVSETDRFGRLLRYVWLHEGDEWLLVNLELVRLGFAQVYTYPPDVRYDELLREAQREAREAGRGLWGDEPPSEPLLTEPPARGDGPCDPAYESGEACGQELVSKPGATG